MSEKNPLFKDLDFRFAAHPITKKLRVLTDIDALKQAVKNLVLMDKYEGLFKPDLNTNIKGSLFDNLDSGDIVLLKERVFNTFKNYEPRVQIQDVKIYNDLDNNRFKMTIYFTPLNRPEPIIVDVFLEKVR